MALFRKFFYRKPPDGLLEITERVYVFDSCFSTDVFDDETYQDYIGDIASHLRSHFADAFFMAFNFRQGEAQSQLSTILSSYDMVVMDYPRHYEGCPLLTMEMIHHFLRSGDSWLSLGQSNVLLLHCERGGWAVLAFMLAGLLLYRKIFVEEQRTLEMIYRQAPRELIQLLSPLNPMPSQIRYLHYISRRNVGAEWPPGDRQLTLDCVILRNIPGFNGEAGCRPIFRIYGQDPKQLGTSNTPKLLFSTPKRSKYARLYKQADCELIKVDIHCHVHGDVVLECISLYADQKREEMMFRVMFNTAFIRSNILMLNRDEVDILWDANDRFPREFRAEVLLSEMDTADQSDPMEEAGVGEKEGLPVEAFSKVQEMFSTTDWIDQKGDAAAQLYQPLATTENINLGAGVVSPGKLDLKERWPFEPASISPTSKESDNAPNKSSSAEQSAVNKQECDGVKKSDPLDLATISQLKSGSSVVHEIAWDVTALLEEDAVSEDYKSCGSTIISSNVSNFASAMVKTPPKPSSGQHATTGFSVVAKSTPQPQPSATAMEASDTRMMSDAIDLFQPSSTHSDLSSLPNTSPSHEQSTLPGTTSLAISHQQSSKIIAKERLPISPARHPPPLPTPPISPTLLPTSSSAGIHCPQPDFLLATISTLCRPTSPPPITPKFAPVRSASLPVPRLPPPPSAPISRPPSSAPKHPPSTPPPVASTSTPISPTPPPPTPPHASTSSPIGLATQSPPSQHASTSSPVLTATPLSSTSFFVTSAPLVPPTTGPTSTPSPPPPPPPCQSSHLPSSPANKALPSAPAPPPPHAPNFSKNERGGCQEDSGNMVPPPQSGLLSKRLQSGQATSKRSNLKPLHWVKVTRAMQGSLWAEGLKTDEASKDPMFDLSELENLFSAALPNPRSDKSGGRTPGTKVEKIHLIDLRRANNCGIMLTKVKMPRPDLMNAILALDDTVLDADQVDNLIKFTPSKEEIELLKGYKGDKQALGECEQFFLELMKVPRVESKLRVFSFKIQFRSQVSDLKRNLNIVNSSAEEIRGSVKLKRIMQTILSLGNALNQGTARGSAVGFRLDSLLKLSDTRARNSKMTLMHYLSKVLFEKLPELLDFPKDLASLDLAAKIQLKSLAEEMQAINKGLEKVEQELITSENDGPVSEIFRKTLKDFLSGAEAEVRALTSLYSIVGRNADALALYFGEDPARCPFEEVVTTLRNFVRLFIRSHEENCKLLELEKRKAQKEAETSYLEKRKAQKEAESLNVVKKKAQKEAQSLDLAKKKAQKEAETLDLENKIAQKEAESLDLLKRKAQKEAEALDLEYKIAQKEAESLDLVKKKAQKEAETLDLIKKKAQKEAETLGLENKKAQKEAETMDLVKRKAQKEAETLDLENKRA